MKGSIDSIESLGLHDGPGIRVVVFFNGCKLRCKYCHNPEMFKKGIPNITVDELVNKILRFKTYIKNGGVTFSGGEPLLQDKFLIEVMKKLKENNIHIALDTSGVGIGNYEEILKYVDLIIYDIKHLDDFDYHNLTGYSIKESLKFLETAINMKSTFWIRQVVVPSIHDNDDYMIRLKRFVDKIPNVEKIELIPFHRLGKEKYDKLGIEYPLGNLSDMSKEKCDYLYQKYFNKIV